MRRGEVWLALYPDHLDRLHPVVLMSWDSHLTHRNQITVVPITGTVRGLDAEVSLSKRDGMKKACVANCDALATIPTSALTERMTTLSETKMRSIEEAIHLALDLRSCAR